MSQIHKRFTSDQVKELLERYSKREIERKYIQQILGIGKSRFFMLLNQYKEHPQLFTIQYVGELIQHDSSYHLWAPAAQEKWYLITSLDD